ncbi:uncharacterized protein LOC143424958 [Xylocopa sonorina]|uniref:uncharacterized protein LOC143424958 n=1 Tax=Xylocopa sonorina TaxID=1818115 RepID=UPI00403A9E87
MLCVVYASFLLREMKHIKLIETVLKRRSDRILLQKRCPLSQIPLTAKYSIKSKGNDEFDEYDKPIKFSTSKAATFPAAYTTADAQNKPWYQDMVVSASLIIFMIYFFIMREENDIDENMIKNIPVEVLEQIYGKAEVEKYKKKFG